MSSSYPTLHSSKPAASSRLRDLLAYDDVERDLYREAFDALHPADIAEALAGLAQEDAGAVLQLLTPEKAAAVLEEASEEVREQTVESLPAQHLATIIDEMEPDDAMDLLQVIAEENEEVLPAVEAALDPEVLADVALLRDYDPESAGGIMTPSVLRVEASASVADVLRKIRAEADDVDSLTYTYIVDADGKLIGVLSLREVLTHEPETPVRELMIADPIAVAADEDQEAVARLHDKYDLMMVPVVDANGRLLGAVTVDDAMDVVQEEHDEDIAYMAGTGTDDPVHGTVWRRLMGRLPWLMVSLGGTYLSAMLLGQFQATLQQVVAVAFFVPIVTAMGGAVGLQSSTTFVRALATGAVEGHSNRLMRLVAREGLVGLSIGLVCAAMTAVLVLILQDQPALAWIVGFSMIMGITVSSLSGTLIPIAVQRVGIDPALAAGPFVTIVNDILALSIYLSTTHFFFSRYLAG